MKKIFYIALTAVLGLAGTSCDREKLTYDSEPGEISGKTGNREKTGKPGCRHRRFYSTDIPFGQWKRNPRKELEIQRNARNSYTKRR